MERSELIRIRKQLNRTQKELAALLGVSLRTLRSYEQGNRSVPGHVERQLYFILSKVNADQTRTRMCWEIKQCPEGERQQCPAWQFGCGALCWFINGTICQCAARESWEEKMATCRNCEVFRAVLDAHRLPDHQ